MSTIDPPPESIERNRTNIFIIDKPDDLDLSRDPLGWGTYNKIFKSDVEGIIYRMSKYTTLERIPDRLLNKILIDKLGNAKIQSKPSNIYYWTPEMDDYLYSVSIDEAVGIGEEEMNELFSNNEIYKKATESDGIVPKIYFNGLVKHGGAGNLYTLIKMEKYSWSLVEFYKQPAQDGSIRLATSMMDVVRPIDYVICSQLLYINYVITGLGYLCTDVKPANFVINTTGITTVFEPHLAATVYSLWQKYLEGWGGVLDGSPLPPPPDKNSFLDMLKGVGILIDVTVDVRAIDLETDMCNKIAVSGRGGDSEMMQNSARLESFLLQNLLLSGTLLTRINWNIFSCVFVDGGLFRERMKSMSNVLLYSKKLFNHNFIRNTSHYFRASAQHYPHDHPELDGFELFIANYLKANDEGEVTPEQVKQFLDYYIRFATSLYTTERRIHKFTPPLAGAAAAGAAAAGDEGAAAAGDEGAAAAEVDSRPENATEVAEDASRAQEEAEREGRGRGFFTRFRDLKRNTKRFLGLATTPVAAAAVPAEETAADEIAAAHQSKKPRRGGSSNNRTKKYKKYKKHGKIKKCKPQKCKKTKHKRKKRNTKKHKRKQVKIHTKRR